MYTGFLLAQRPIPGPCAHPAGKQKTRGSANPASRLERPGCLERLYRRQYPLSLPDAFGLSVCFENTLFSCKRAYVKGIDGHIFAAANLAPEVQMQLGIIENGELIAARAHAALLSRQAYWRYRVRKILPIKETTTDDGSYWQKQPLLLCFNQNNRALEVTPCRTR